MPKERRKFEIDKLRVSKEGKKDIRKSDLFYSRLEKTLKRELKEGNYSPGKMGWIDATVDNFLKKFYRYFTKKGEGSFEKIFDNADFIAYSYAGLLVMNAAEKTEQKKIYEIGEELWQSMFKAKVKYLKEGVIPEEFIEEERKRLKERIKEILDIKPEEEAKEKVEEILKAEKEGDEKKLEEGKKELEERVEELERKVKDLEMKINDVEGSRKEFGNEFEDIKKRINELEEELKELNKRISARGADEETLKKIEKAFDEIEQLKERVKKLEEMAKPPVEEAKEIEGEIDEMKGGVEEGEKKARTRELKKFFKNIGQRLKEARERIKNRFKKAKKEETERKKEYGERKKKANWARRQTEKLRNAVIALGKKLRNIKIPKIHLRKKKEGKKPESAEEKKGSFFGRIGKKIKEETKKVGNYLNEKVVNPIRRKFRNEENKKRIETNREKEGQTESKSKKFLEKAKDAIRWLLLPRRKKLIENIDKILNNKKNIKNMAGKIGLSEEEYATMLYTYRKILENPEKYIEDKKKLNLVMMRVDELINNEDLKMKDALFDMFYTIEEIKPEFAKKIKGNLQLTVPYPSIDLIMLSIENGKKDVLDLLENKNEDNLIKELETRQGIRDVIWKLTIPDWLSDAKRDIGRGNLTNIESDDEILRNVDVTTKRAVFVMSSYENPKTEDSDILLGYMKSPKKIYETFIKEQLPEEVRNLLENDPKFTSKLR